MASSSSPSPSSPPRVHGGGGGTGPGSGNGHHHQDDNPSRDILMVSLSRFYSQKNHMQLVIPYISCQSDVSLRLIDWFVTNYAKKHNIILTHREKSNNNVVHFNVYLNYRAQLKAYSKQQFDPFRRRDRVMFYYDRNRSVETTVGQLNFFRWMLQNEILEYVSANVKAIEADMNAAQKATAAASSSPAVEAVNGVNGVKTHQERQERQGRQERQQQQPAASKTPKAPEDERGGGGEGARGGGGGGRKKRTELSQCKATRIMTRIVGERMMLFD